MHGGVHIHRQAGSGESRVVPHQLPASLRHFVNRVVEQDALTTLLNGADRENTLLVSAVDGLAGVGKSTLAVQWAHQVRDRFPDGELYVDLRGFHAVAEPMTASEALAVFLTALGVVPETIPAEEEARAGQFRTLVHGRRMLIVLDNARDTEQVLPLLPGSPGCLVVVTSRVRLDGLVAHYGAQRLPLATLAHDESRLLLARFLGMDRLTSESDAVEALLEHCAGLPLALTLVAVLAAAEPDVPLADLAADLRDERNRLDTLDAGGHTGVRAVFSWSYRSLSPKAARQFRLLGLPNNADIALPAAAALAGVDQHHCRQVLAELTRVHLLTRRAGNRYGFHDLLRAYARERAHADDSVQDRTAALGRLLDYYFSATYAARYTLTGRGLSLLEVDVADEQAGNEFTTYDKALTWWDHEHTNVLGVVRQTAALTLRRSAWLAHTATYLFKLRGLYDEWKAACTNGLQAARANADRAAEARLLLDLGSAHAVREEFRAAVACLDAAADLLSELDDGYWEAVARQMLGEVLLDQGRYQEAAATQEQVLQMISEDAGEHGETEAAAHTVLGLALTHLGEFPAAFAHLHQSLNITGASEFARGYTLSSLGFAYLRAGRAKDAVRAYQQAVQHRRGIAHRWGEATSLNGLGTALRASGDNDGARNAWHQALDIFDQLGSPDADTVRAHLNAVDIET